jgi:hypothetical protein
MKRRDVRMRGILPALTLRIGERKMLRKADRIGIPRGEIEVVADLPVIEIVEKAHEVVGDPSPGRMATDNLALHAVISGDLLRLKPPIVERAAGLGSITVRFGSATSSKLWTSIDQNTDPQASLSRSGV